jgi:hypothetical protein
MGARGTRLLLRLRTGRIEARGKAHGQGAADEDDMKNYSHGKLTSADY